MLTNASMMTVS